MMNVDINPGTKVETILDQWPATIAVFNHHRMGCVGCSMAMYETLAGAAEIYHLSLDQFIDELNGVIQEALSDTDA